MGKVRRIGGLRLSLKDITEMDQSVLAGGVGGGGIGLAGHEEISLELLHHTVEGVASFTGEVFVETRGCPLLCGGGITSWKLMPRFRFASTLLVAFCLPADAVDLAPPIRAACCGTRWLASSSSERTLAGWS